MKTVLIINDAAHYIPALNTDNIVPRKGEVIKYENTTYLVATVIYNLDIEEIHVYLNKNL